MSYQQFHNIRTRSPTAVAQQRRNKDEGKARFYIDQTLRRYKLREMAVEYVKNKSDVHFVFVGVSCNLCIRMNSCGCELRLMY